MHDRDIRTRLKALAHDVDEAAAVVVRHGKASRAILEEAEALGADAIVLTSHRPNFRNHMLETTASRVAQHATCSVVIDRSNV